MEPVASYCLTEPGSGSDAAALRTRARRDGDHYVLDGAKQFISRRRRVRPLSHHGAHRRRGAGRRLRLLVPKDTPGLSFGANERKMGWNAQPTRQVIFDGARVPADALLGEEGQGFRFAMAGLDGGRLNIAACSLGGAQAALDKALAYVQERRAFGKAVADFQNTQFRLADMRDRAGGGAHPAVAGLRQAGRAGAGRHGLLRHGQALRHRHRATGWPTTRCNCSAAMATWRNTASRRSCATSASTASWKAPTRSCG